jgi:small subunit ribosomal protein S21|tara:strand:- start:107 stop:334 length:228 start_codon:yes stop_codon:yes gene_type:complete
MRHIKSDRNAIVVRNNNIDQALRIMKKKLLESGLFNELRDREHYVSKGERRRHSIAAAKRRVKKDAAKRLAEEGY